MKLAVEITVVVIVLSLMFWGFWLICKDSLGGSSPEMINTEKPINADRPRQSLDDLDEYNYQCMKLHLAPLFIVQLRDEIKQLKAELEELRGK